MAQTEFRTCFAYGELTGTDRCTAADTCWKVVGCGREPGGFRNEMMGVCRVAAVSLAAAGQVETAV